MMNRVELLRAEHRILALLAKTPWLLTRDIALQAGISRRDAKSLLQRLLARKLLERHIQAGPMGINHWSLTDAGRAYQANREVA